MTRSGVGRLSDWMSDMPAGRWRRLKEGAMGGACVTAREAGMDRRRGGGGKALARGRKALAPRPEAQVNALAARSGVWEEAGGGAGNPKGYV